ncbi:POT family proton-dependent oligopeptide transporter [Chryseobacterium defluvii]|uniref:POT family proton-dependent oligopeptide transporter n=1 Tax=Chryseobacterium defluvii TaxID=160396 RepID=A0A840KK48_9FLAO|nr:peptide MFS transporter [Chryseobacterium defluvii]MBB4807880.1 POT family proton-dependent oligopeptide transporter [Chryseobacterium defluvii]
MDTVQQKGHPKGLWVLFSTEMWERFNFYGMRAILSLFMVHALMLGESNASIIYGGFLALCYLTPLLGGFISDRFLGNRYCIILGGSLMAIGQLLLFYSASTFDGNLDLSKSVFWLGLLVIIFGNGFFKPNISSMVGSLYPPSEKTKLDSAFTIFYMGINIGALLSQYFVPMIADVVVDGKQDPYVFKWGYLLAAIAMILGTLIFFFLKNKYVVTPEGRPIGGLPKHNTSADFEEGETQTAKFSGASLGITGLIFVALFFVFRYILVGEFGFSSVEMGQLIKGIIYPFIYSAGISLAFLIMSSAENKVERQRIWVIYIVSFFIIFFWAAFEQAGSSLTFIASNQTDRTFLFGWQMPASMVQIFNGLFVVILAVPFSLMWDNLRAKGKEPISPFKQALGLALIALSYFIIAYNVKDLGNSGLLAIKWLILLYFIQTCGELCLSPIGLSLVGKLAPKRFASLLYGVFFISNAAGYALAGTLGSILPATGDKFKKAQEIGVNLQDVLDKKVTLNPDQVAAFEKAQLPLQNPTFAGFEIHNLFEFFMVFVVLCGIAAVILALISPVLKRMMHGVK